MSGEGRVSERDTSSGARGMLHGHAAPCERAAPEAERFREGTPKSGATSSLTAGGSTPALAQPLLALPHVLHAGSALLHTEHGPTWSDSRGLLDEPPCRAEVSPEASGGLGRVIATRGGKDRVEAPLLSEPFSSRVPAPRWRRPERRFMGRAEAYPVHCDDQHFSTRRRGLPSMGDLARGLQAAALTSCSSERGPSGRARVSVSAETEQWGEGARERLRPTTRLCPDPSATLHGPSFQNSLAA